MPSLVITVTHRPRSRNLLRTCRETLSIPSHARDSGFAHLRHTYTMLGTVTHPSQCSGGWAPLFRS